AALTPRPPVSSGSMRSVRRTVASSARTLETAVTRAMRAIARGALAGSVASPPPRCWPGATVSRLVPRRSRRASRPAREDSDSPSTATMLAIPIATPSAESAARSRRMRSPAAASPLARRRGAVEQAVGDVLQRGHPVEQEELLEDEPDRPGAQAGEPAVVERGDVLAGDRDASGRRQLERRHHVQQRRPP